MLAPDTYAPISSARCGGKWARSSGRPVIVIDDAVLEAILEFSEQDVDRERGGFLLGGVYGDDAIPPGGEPRCVVITHFHPALEAQGQLASLTFTHETWAALTREARRIFRSIRSSAGSTRTPASVCFFSAYDRSSTTTSSPSAWQVALVVDPRRHEFGFFQWREGKSATAAFSVFPLSASSRR